MFSILHISDLHRSAVEPVNNDALLAALLADQDRYVNEIPRIPPPGAIIASGDMVQGVPLGVADFESQMSGQYDIAYEFLAKLADRFVKGDRSQVVLVPGNHDICWNTSLAAMQPVTPDQYPPNLADAVLESDGVFRWSWKERALYKVVDHARYAARLDAYWRFVERYYGGHSLALPLSRARGFQVYSLDQGRTCVVAFDSTHGNDCYCYVGGMAPGVIGRSMIALRDAGISPNLSMAVWHHSIQGPPKKEDYLDISNVLEMAGLGYQVGIHGHQHLAAATTQYVHLDVTQAMAVISGGSICAGSRELPRGVNRQYNLIVVEDDYRHGRVHVREVGEGEQFYGKRNGAFLTGHIEVSWQQPLDSAGRRIDLEQERKRRTIFEAEARLKSGYPNEALVLLKDLALLPGTLERSLATEAARTIESWGEVASIVADPASVDEAILLVVALTRLKRLPEAKALLEKRTDIPEGARRDLQGTIRTAEAMGKK